jgi:hypothetical protein
MGRQLIAMRMRVCVMPGVQHCFCLRVMGCMRVRMIHGVVTFFLIMAFLVLAGL